MSAKKETDDAIEVDDHTLVMATWNTPYIVKNGAVKAYKKIYCETKNGQSGAIAELLIPRGAIIDHEFGTNMFKTTVYQITDIKVADDTEYTAYTKCYSIYDNKFEYKKDKRYYAKIVPGLWFYTNRRAAEKYMM